MAIGLGILRSARVAGRKAEASRPTIREVCLIGMDHPAGNKTWTTGQEVSWLGREYRVMAGVATETRPESDGPLAGSPRQYVHLAPSDRD